MGKHIPISYKGNRLDQEAITALARQKNMGVGELVAGAVEAIYGEELKITRELLLAMADRLNERSLKLTGKQHSNQN